MKNALCLFAGLALFLLASPVMAQSAGPYPAGSPDGFLVAQAPPPGMPPGGPGGRPSPRAQAIMQCNVQQAQCADNCNYRFFGPQRNLCYNQCNGNFVRCTSRANRLPAY